MAYQDGVPALEVLLVGRLRVVADGGQLSDQQVGTRKARLLLQRLAAARGEVLALDALTEAVWTDAPPSAPVDNLATLVSRLRASLGADVVVGDRGAWRIGPAVQVDLDVAAALLAQAEAALARHEPTVAAAAATRAVAALTGDVLADAPAAGWAEDVRTETAAVLRRARRVAATAAVDAGDPAAAVELATAAIRADPYDEVAARVLMQAHRGGRRAGPRPGGVRGAASPAGGGARGRPGPADARGAPRAVDGGACTVVRRGLAPPPTRADSRSGGCRCCRATPAPVVGSDAPGRGSTPVVAGRAWSVARRSTPTWSAGGRPRSAASRACCWSWASPGSARPG